MDLTTLNQTVISEAGIEAAQRYIAPVKVFASNFSPAEGVEYGAVQVPVYALSGAAAFDESSNNWCNGESVNGAVVNLDTHIIESIKITDVQNGNVSLAWQRDGARALVRSVARSVEQTVVNAIETATLSTALTADIALSAVRESIAALQAECAAAGIDPYDSALLLKPTVFGKLLSELTYSVTGESTQTNYGVIENLYGFYAVVQAPGLTSSGFVVPRNAVALANRWNYSALGGYALEFPVTDEKSGLTFGVRAHENLCKGAAYLGVDALFGVKVIQDDKIIKLIAG
jgi:hypothetical protein